MWAALMLVGFAPWHAEPPSPAAEPLPTGAPAPHIPRSAGLSARLTQTERWHDFTAAWGGSWAARWDPRTLGPRFLYAPGVPVEQADALVADVARLAGVDPAELVPAKPRIGPDRTWLRWTRTWSGAAVEGDDVMLSVQHGRIGGVWVRLSPVAGLPLPRPGEIVRPLPSDKVDALGRPTGVEAHLVTRTQTADTVTYTLRSGETLHRYSRRHYDDLQVSHLARTIGDPHVESPARQLFVEDASGGVDTTADDGTHALRGTVSVQLDGPALEIRRNGSVQAPLVLTPDSAGTSVMEGGVHLSEASASVLHHTHVVFDWLADRWPSHGWLGEKVPANVDISSSACNAYYTSGTINFFVGYGSSCYNYGQVADVIYHEVGHGIHHFILAGGTFAGDVSEGSADYVSATINDDPTIGLNSKPGGGIVRELETDRVYPDDAVGEVHADGLIWGSFLWNLRAEWQAAYGPEAGAERTDLLFLGALEQGPSLTDLYEAVILADDDDGDLSNGTPHACELKDLLDQHGLGPGPMGVVVLEHLPLGPQSSAATEYPIELRVSSPTADCADYDPDSVALWFTTGPLGAVPGVDTDDPTAWEGWTEVSLEVDAETGTWFTGAVPRQLATTEVHYLMLAQSTDGAETLWSHGGTRAGVHSFRVGDRRATWCEDFEGGLPAGWVHAAGLPGSPRGDLWDQWEVAEPTTGASFVPDTAPSGSRVVGTHVGGLYAPNNQQFLGSSAIPVGDGRMTLLTYERWLTVEDGIYDRAWASVDGQRYFDNPSSSSGLDHTLDVDWRTVELEVDLLRDTEAADGALVLEWALETDPGLEFGGWHLDDVCVVELADVPAHYRRMQLTAELDPDDRVTLRWENPWIEPLDRVMLVSTDGPTLDDLDTADVLLVVEGATPGAAGTYLDGLPLEPGTDRTYAVVAAVAPELDFETDLTDGDNRVTVSLEPLPTGDTGTPDDSGDTTTDPRPADDTGSAVRPEPSDGKASGCACTASSGRLPRAGWLLALLPLVVRRRLRSPPLR